MVAAFGKTDNWIQDPKIPAGHTMTFRDSLHVALENIRAKLVLPEWIFGPECTKGRMVLGGIVGRGWLGKGIRDIGVAYAELGVRYV